MSESLLGILVRECYLGGDGSAKHSRDDVEGNWDVRTHGTLVGAIVQAVEGPLDLLKIGLRQFDAVERRVSGANDLRRCCGCPLVAQWSACRSNYRLG